jgi:S-DNA-T family DNA segregation ATPase FtsK/SpoIIIE
MALKSNKLKVKPTTEKVGNTTSSAKSKSKTAKSTKTTKKSKVKSTKSNSIFSDKRFIRSIGFLFLVIGIYLFLAITTFIVNWFASDNGEIIKLTAEQYKDHTETVTNWTGWLGSFIAKHLIYNGIGLGSYFISLVFVSICCVLEGICLSQAK